MAVGSASEAMSHCAEMGAVGLLSVSNAAEFEKELDGDLNR